MPTMPTLNQSRFDRLAETILALAVGIALLGLVFVTFPGEQNRDDAFAKINAVQAGVLVENATTVPHRHYRGENVVIVRELLAKVAWTGTDGKRTTAYFIDGVRRDGRAGEPVQVYVHRKTGEPSLIPWLD